MDRRAYPGWLLATPPPPRWAGLLAGAGAVALCTVLIYPLKQIAPVVSLGVVYLLAVLFVSTTWGAWLGVVTAVVSAAAFNFFHLPPTGRFTLRNSEDWVALSAFLVVAVLASSLAEAARRRAREAEDRRAEADLAAEMARLLLRGEVLQEALTTSSQRLAHTLGLTSAATVLDAVDGDDRRVAFPLREDARRLGTVLVPADSSEAALRRLQERVVPSLEALLSAALERQVLHGEVVETAALRQADVVKTTLLRAVSHDLRSPLTAIRAAAESVGSPGLSDQARAELISVIQDETGRLSRLVENLLDVSRLEAGAAEPRREWTSVHEVIAAALADIGAPPDELNPSLDPELPFVRADGSQLERALVNVLDNALRYSGGHPVSLRARAVRDRVIIRVVDRGPGIPPAQQERVFQPFYRAGTAHGGHRGSGLGLAIARGFIEINGGRIHVESLPGQGATFVIELPVDSPTPGGTPHPVAGQAAA